jgi:hypothetical protein
MNGRGVVLPDTRRYGSAMYKVWGGERRLIAVQNRCTLIRASNSNGGSLGLIFLHKMRALVEGKGVGMTYLPKRARCRAFRGCLSSNEQLWKCKLSGKRGMRRYMHLVPIPGSLARWGLQDRGPNGAQDAFQAPIYPRRRQPRGHPVVLTAYAKWTRRSDAKEAGASAIDRRP